eukprot:512553_1
MNTIHFVLCISPFILILFHHVMVKRHAKIIKKKEYRSVNIDYEVVDLFEDINVGQFSSIQELAHWTFVRLGLEKYKQNIKKELQQIKQYKYKKCLKQEQEINKIKQKACIEQLKTDIDEALVQRGYSDGLKQENICFEEHQYPLSTPRVYCHPVCGITRQMILLSIVIGVFIYFTSNIFVTFCNLFYIWVIVCAYNIYTTTKINKCINEIYDKLEDEKTIIRAVRQEWTFLAISFRSIQEVYSTFVFKKSIQTLCLDSCIVLDLDNNVIIYRGPLPVSEKEEERLFTRVLVVRAWYLHLWQTFKPIFSPKYLNKLVFDIISSNPDATHAFGEQLKNTKLIKSSD